jgi:predicted RND superfamily exporter protein
LSATFRDWKFGVIESVCVTLLVGLSVDYPLHVASAYAAASSTSKTDDDKERQTRDREEDAKTKESIENTPPPPPTTTPSPPPLSPSALSAKTNASNDRRRASRTLRAIRSVGPSVIGGALTTASAAAFLFRGCVIVFFTTFGAFVIVVLCMSVLSSAFVLTAALAVAGPA